jgi:hypothetical protein
MGFLIAAQFHKENKQNKDSEDNVKKAHQNRCRILKKFIP